MGFSMMRVALNAGAALAPLIAAALILVDWNLLLWVDAATALAYAALARALLPAGHTPAAEATDEDPARAGSGVLVRDRRYLLFLASVLLGTVIYIQYTVALPLSLRASGHPAALYSIVLATTSLVLITCELKITASVKGRPPHLIGAVGTAIMGLGLAGYGLATGSSAVIVLSTIVFVCGLMINGPTMFAHPSKFPAAVKARYIGAHQFTFGLGLALGPIVGVLAYKALANGVWVLCGALGTVAALCALTGMRTSPTA